MTKSYNKERGEMNIMLNLGYAFPNKKQNSHENFTRFFFLNFLRSQNLICALKDRQGLHAGTCYKIPVKQRGS